MNLIEKISGIENDMIYYYRKEYAFSESSHGGTFFAPNQNILDVWQTAKNEYLAKMFNSNLILERPVEYNISSAEIMENIRRMLENEGTPKDFYWKFMEWSEKYCKDHDIRPWYDDSYYRINGIMTVKNLAENIYTGDTVEIFLANGHRYKVQQGAKMMKILGKIAESYNIEGFEQFRIAHSMILNDTKIHGKMCVSIHPLDYMTLSDNDSDWSSCMSWNDHGCYRQGTVEMMNSPMVVVAYLKSAETSYDINGYVWNNKKWRELFIVDPRFILNIKSYPYNNEFLTSYAMNWLRELAIANLGWSFDEDKITYEPGNDFYIDEKKYRICPETRLMYNDFYNSPYNSFAYLAKDLEPARYSFYYSGLSQCMVCGDTNEDGANFEAEGNLTCDSCEPVMHCECCGDRIDEDYAYWLDDMAFCEDCYYDHKLNDSFDGEEHYDENMTRIHIAPALAENDENTDNSHEGNIKIFWGYYMDTLYTYYGRPEKETSYFENFFTNGVHYKEDRFGARYYYVRVDEIIPGNFNEREYDFNGMQEEYLSDNACTADLINRWHI